MRIAYIRPRMGSKKNREAMEPLAIAALHAVAPEGHEYVFYDEMVEDLPAHIDADVVAMTVQTFSAARAYAIADQMRHEGKKVVLGGPHISLRPNEALCHADVVATGAGEHVWPKIVGDIAATRTKSIYEGGLAFGSEGYDRSIYGHIRYLPVLPVEYQRGCAWNCDFCSVPLIQPGKPIRREEDRVASEIASMSHRNILFVDDNLYASVDSLKRLLAAIRPLKIRWGCQISMNVVNHEGIVDEMARSGCVVVLIGFESVMEENLTAMNKRANVSLSRSYRDVVRRFYDAGIFVYGSFVFGYDGDTMDTLKRTLDFAIESRLFLANFNTLTPMPSTALYDRLQREGRLLHPLWWLDEGLRYGEVMFRPLRMEAEALKEGCMSLRSAFYATRSLATRFPFQSVLRGDVFKLFLYATANIVTGRSLFDKMSEVR